MHVEDVDDLKSQHEEAQVEPPIHFMAVYEFLARQQLAANAASLGV